MNITSLQMYQMQPFKTDKPAFKSSRRVVYNGNEILYRTTTEFFRDDLNWSYLPIFLENHFKGIPKINVYDYGCSSGEEAVSLAIMLIKKLEILADKYFPIIAKDLDIENIMRAKTGLFLADKIEHSTLSAVTSPNSEKFYTETPVTLSTSSKEYANFMRQNGFMIQFTDLIRKKIKFSQQDIMQDLQNIKAENTVLLCRNFWPYLSKISQLELMSQLSKKFEGTKSLLILGDYDVDSQNDYVRKLLYQYHFRETILSNVFERKQKPKEYYNC